MEPESSWQVFTKVGTDTESL